MLQKFKGHLLAAQLAAAVALMSVGPVAFAGDLADAITAEVTGAKAEMLLVAVIVLGITGVILLVKSVRRVAH